MKDQDINLDDIPEILDWSKGVRGKFYRPVKQAISIRVDADVLTWFRTRSGKYQSKMNEALREYMQKRRRA
ncbi:MAG: BrnA antitoxin family protein [Sulfuricaulis sp.]